MFLNVGGLGSKTLTKWFSSILQSCNAILAFIEDKSSTFDQTKFFFQSLQPKYM